VVLADAIPAISIPKSRALIVDDDASVRHALNTTLTKCQFDIIEAVNGVAAVEGLARERADVVFSDATMLDKALSAANLASPDRFGGK
jgi:DNA-binding NtrC family response regulator